MTYYISQGKVEAPIRVGVRHSSVANLLRYLCGKYYQNIMQLEKVIANNKRMAHVIFCPTV